ncbi:Hypothetical_protein [Hexamita inflata]|uniref:Hypothetical_protein n=1 Tax=Hexamita inflata TaxID=28002 RepID=A0AA86PYG5_9EUKA|nr:Hypothetical protein HINF_LOCUS30922 [Hexamita inflata]CAI9961119.1 Hypothetical protein HINF_LOCUS48764 [Hexamita inflata]
MQVRKIELAKLLPKQYSTKSPTQNKRAISPMRSTYKDMLKAFNIKPKLLNQEIKLRTNSPVKFDIQQRQIQIQTDAQPDEDYFDNVVQFGKSVANIIQQEENAGENISLKMSQMYSQKQDKVTIHSVEQSVMNQIFNDK